MKLAFYNDFNLRVVTGNMARGGPEQSGLTEGGECYQECTRL